MNCCNDFMIMEYLDGQLPKEQMAAVQKHLETCAKCKALLFEYKALYKELESSESFEPSADFTQEVMANLPDINFRQKSWIARMYQAAALVIFLGLAIWPYLPLLANLGSVWDSIRVYFTVFANIWNVVAVFLKVLAVVLEQFINILRLTGSAFQLDQSMLLVISGQILVANGLIIKYFLTKMEWRN